jgi:hemolysin D
MKSSESVVAFPRGRDRRERHELAFLPAALEIMETPPSPIGRATAIIVAVLFCLVLAWACLGQIDIVATAPGKIVTSGGSKVIQPFETGVVRAIHVNDGQTVKAGDLLIELDATLYEAERNRHQSDLTAARLDVARLRAALAAGPDPVADFHPPANASPALVAVTRQFLINQTSEYRAKLAVIDAQTAQKEAERATIMATIKKIEALIPTIQKRVDIRKELHAKEYGSTLQYYEMLQMLVEQQQELAVQNTQRLQIDTALAEIAQNRVQTIAEYQRTLSGELVEAERKAAGLAQDVAKAEQRIKLQLLTAPVDGVVQQLAIHTIGGVVTPAQSLLVLVPVDRHLEIEAMVSNRDIGFVYAGQDAEIKIDTFNFTRYGLCHGKVLHVSEDAVPRDKPQDRSNGKAPGAEATTSEPKGQDLSYAARISLDRTQMQVENKLVNLTPGMAVTAEIRTGSRAIITYLLSPILKVAQESLHER